MNETQPQPTVPMPKRRWHPFRLRTLLVFVTLCAIPCSWVGIRLEKVRAQQRVVTALRNAGLKVYYEYQLDENGRPAPEDEWRGAVWLRTWVGDDLLSVPKRIDSPADCVGGIGGIHFFCNRTIGDAELVGIETLVHLKYLNLNGTSISDSSLPRLQGLTELEDLSLSNTKITDSGVAYLGRLRRLHRLELNETSLSEEGLTHLYGLDRLARLSVIPWDRSSYNLTSLAELQAALPSCEISIAWWDRR